MNEAARVGIFLQGWPRIFQLREPLRVATEGRQGRTANIGCAEAQHDLSGRRLKTFFFLLVIGFSALAPAAQAGPQVILTIPGIGPGQSPGQITVELHEDKPQTVANFLAYIDAGRYENSFAHQLVLAGTRTDMPAGALKGGQFIVLPPDDQTPSYHPGPVQIFAPIVNEYNVGQIRSNVLGTLAMARSDGDADSATSEWFFNLGDNSVLDGIDGGFTVFGNVIGGLDVLMLFNTTFPSGTGGRGWYDASSILGSPFSPIPLLAGVLSTDNLIYTNWTVVPEPGISGLVISGAFVLLSARRRRPAVSPSSVFR